MKLGGVDCQLNVTRAEGNENHGTSLGDKAHFGVVLIAVSADGLATLGRLLSGLPGDFPAAVVVVQHLDPQHGSLATRILDCPPAMTTKLVIDGDILSPGTIFIAPPNYQLLVNADGSLSLSPSELVRFVHPSTDLLFESAAARLKDRVVIIVLTGSVSNGATGIRAIKNMGGRVIVQDEALFEFIDMPTAAVDSAWIDASLPLEEIPAALVALFPKQPVLWSREPVDTEAEHRLAQRRQCLREAAFNAGQVAEVVLDTGGKLVLANVRARHMLPLAESDMGRSFGDIKSSLRRLGLGSYIERSYGEQRPVRLKGIKRMLSDGNPQYLDIGIVPLLEDNMILGVSLRFTDVTQDMAIAHKKLETTIEELQSRIQQLHYSNTELEEMSEDP